MKRLFILSFSALLALGCQDQLITYRATCDFGSETKSGTYTVQVDERYIFPAEKDLKSLTDIVSIEDRFAACEVPETVLRVMTTSALVQTMINYPLNFIFSAYNNPFDAIDLIVKNSALHRELIRRNDAAEELIRLFAESSIDITNTKSVFNTSSTSLSYANELFLEYLLASRLIPGLYEGEQGLALVEIAQRKMKERNADTKTFSGFSIEPLRLLSETATDETGLRSGSWIWYTPFGHALLVNSNDEFTIYETAYWTDIYVGLYPNTSLGGMASNLYNGHGYAWIKNDPTDANSGAITNAWLERYYFSDNQLQSLWIGDFYIQTPSASEALKIYYEDADHSAIYSSVPDSLYVSKWGYGPLMEHAPAYCPYSTSNRKFYKVRTTRLVTGSIEGPSSLSLNVPSEYAFQSSPLRGITLVWTVDCLYPGTSSSYSFNPTTHTLCCYEYGVWEIKVEGYFNGDSILYQEKLVSCMP